MYEDFYHLYTCPFSREPNPDFFFPSKEHKQALSYLRFGVDKHEGNVVITGDKGVGKTLLSSMLLLGLDPAQVIAGRIVVSESVEQDITVQICQEFGLNIRERTSTKNLLNVIQQFLQVCQSLNRTVLLVLDEAHNLSLEALEKLEHLSNYKQVETPFMQMFFIGQARLRQTIMTPSMSILKGLMIASSHLHPLSEREVSHYIRHRLRYAGWSNRELFTEDACHEIFHEANGIPAQINHLCRKLLSYGSHQGFMTINAAALHLAMSEAAFEDTAV